MKLGDKLMKKKIFLGILLIVLALVGVGGYFTIHPKANTDVSKYMDKSEFSGKGNLLIFPDKVNEGEVLDYYYWNRGGVFDDDYQIYLVCKYDEDKFHDEVSRLTNISVTYKSDTHTINNNTTDYKFNAYETINNWDYGYEYALVDEANRTIYYVHLEFIDEDEVIFDHSLLPDSYGAELDNPMDGYNMYAFQEGEGAYHVVD